MFLGKQDSRSGLVSITTYFFVRGSSVICHRLIRKHAPSFEQSHFCDTPALSNFSSVRTKRLAGLLDESVLSMKPRINREEVEIVFADEPHDQVGLNQASVRFFNQFTKDSVEWSTNILSSFSFIFNLKDDLCPKINFLFKIVVHLPKELIDSKTMKA